MCVNYGRLVSRRSPALESHDGDRVRTAPYGSNETRRLQNCSDDGLVRPRSAIGLRIESEYLGPVPTRERVVAGRVAARTPRRAGRAASPRLWETRRPSDVCSRVCIDARRTEQPTQPWKRSADGRHPHGPPAPREGRRGAP